LTSKSHYIAPNFKLQVRLIQVYSVG